MRSSSAHRKTDAGAAVTVLLAILVAMVFLYAPQPTRAAADEGLQGSVKDQIQGINTDVKKKKTELEQLNMKADS